MPISVDVPGHGLVEFPDGTDEATMTKAIRGLTGAPERRNAPAGLPSADALSVAGVAASLAPAALALGRNAVEEVATNPGLTAAANIGRHGVMGVPGVAQIAAKVPGLSAVVPGVKTAIAGKQVWDVMTGKQNPVDAAWDAAKDYAVSKVPGLVQSAAAKVAPMLPEVGAAGAAGATLGAIVPVAFLRWLQSEAARRPEIDPHAKTLQASIFNVLSRTGSPDERREYVVNHPDDDIADAMINAAPSGERLALRTARNAVAMGGRLRR